MDFNQSQSRVELLRMVCLQGLNTVLGDQSQPIKRSQVGQLLNTLDAILEQLKVQIFAYPRFQSVGVERMSEIVQQERAQLMMSLLAITPADNHHTQLVEEVLRAQVQEVELWVLLFGAQIDEDETKLISSSHSLQDILRPRLKQANKLHVQYEEERAEVQKGDSGELLFLKAQRVNAHQDESMTLALINRNLSQLAA